MITTTPMPGNSQAADRDIEAAWNQYDEEQEEEESQPDIDRESTVAKESLDDIYRDLLHDFPMVDRPLPPSGSDSFGDFVAKEHAKEADAGMQSPKPGPAEEMAEAVRKAKIAEGVKNAKAEKRRRMETGAAPKRDTKGHSVKESFKGIFMSAAILAEPNLLPIDKMLLALVDSFATGKEKKSGRFTGPCTASNEAIAMYLGESVRYTCKRISLLQNQEKILTWSQKGKYTRRVVAPGLSKDREITEKWIAKLG